MRIPRRVRDLQVGRESLFLDFSSQRLFHGLDLFFAQRRQELSFRAVVSDAMSCDHQGQCHVHVLMDDHLASGQSLKVSGDPGTEKRVPQRAKSISLFCGCKSVTGDFVSSSLRWFFA